MEGETEEVDFLWWFSATFPINLASIVTLAGFKIKTLVL